MFGTTPVRNAQHLYAQEPTQLAFCASDGFHRQVDRMDMDSQTESVRGKPEICRLPRIEGNGVKQMST